MKFVLIALMAFMITACGPNVELLGGYLGKIDDPQNKAGLVYNHTSFCKNELGGYEVCDTELWDGKEEAEVTIDWQVDQNGTLSLIYKATDSRAFQAFATRAELQSKLGEALGARVFDTIQMLANPTSAITPNVSNPN